MTIENYTSDLEPVITRRFATVPLAVLAEFAASLRVEIVHIGDGGHAVARLSPFDDVYAVLAPGFAIEDEDDGQLVLSV